MQDPAGRMDRDRTDVEPAGNRNLEDKSEAIGILTDLRQWRALRSVPY